MTLEDAIAYYSEMVKKCRWEARIESTDYMDMKDRAYEAEQLADWLNELKVLRERINVRKKGEWIPCSDRMPDEHEWPGTKKFGTTISNEVYVTFETPDGQRFAEHINFQNGKLSPADEQRMKVWFKGAKPIAWMPLPEPYRGEEK